MAPGHGVGVGSLWGGSLTPQLNGSKTLLIKPLSGFTAQRNLGHGTDGLYLFNDDCHRLKAKPWKFRGIPQTYTAQEIGFLEHALDPQVLRNHDKWYFVSHCTY